LDRPTDTGAQAISDLVRTFNTGNGRQRQAAREQLVEMGPVAVPALIQALGDSQEQVRWEAAKALTELPDPQAADPLVARLNDSFGIRWLASEALINIGEPSFVPLVRALVATPDAPRLRDSAHHVLTKLKRAYPTNPHISAMLNALSGQAQTETVPWVGRRILQELGHIPPE